MGGTWDARGARRQELGRKQEAALKYSTISHSFETPIASRIGRHAIESLD